MNKGIRGLAVGVSIASILASAFYGADVRAVEVSDTDGETKGVVSTDIRPQDDYYGYINAGVLKEADIDPKYGYGSFSGVYQITNGKMYSIIDEVNAGGFATSTDAELISDYYKQISSYDASKSDADADFEKVREEIESVSSIKELYELIGKYQAVYDVNPLYSFSISDGFTKSDEYSFAFEGIESILGTKCKDIAGTEDGRHKVRGHVKDVLLSLGTDKKEAEQKADNFAVLAVDIAYDIKDSRMELSSVKTLSDKEMNDLKFDTESFVKGYGIDNPYDKWVIYSKDQMTSISEALADEDNLEAFKTWLLVEYIDKYNEYLSDDYKDLKDIYGEQTESLDVQAKEKIINNLPDQIGRLYTAAFYPESKDKQVREMCENIRESYRKLIGNADWLTEDGRTKLLAKLEAIEFKTGGSYEESLVSTNNLIGSDEYETYKNLIKYKYETSKEKIKRPRPKMGQTMQPQTVNACFWVDNVVVMTAAITEEPFFSENYSDAGNLGRLGMVIAHEVGHAFDSNCINWDDKGVYNPEWLCEKDREALKERADMCIDYYSEYTIMDVYHVDGKLTLGENYADLGALECITNIPEKKEEFIDLFEGFGEIWRGINSDVEGIYLLHHDEHSPGIVRVNATLSSCDKFYETYDVKEGDGMYVAPENRVERW